MTDAVATVTEALPIPDEQKQQITQKASQVGNQLNQMITSQVGDRASQTGQQASSIAQALRSSGAQLEDQGQDAPARVIHLAADRADQLGSYLSTSDPNQILTDIEDLCRQQPWAVIVGGVALGFLAARFLKASSSRRATTRYGGYSVPARYPEVDGYGYRGHLGEEAGTYPSGGI